MNAPTPIKLALHQFCEIIPPCTEQEFKELKEDIKKNGLQLPIKLFADQILDGRSRYKACVELGIDFKTEVFSGTAKDALAYVISMNVKRRHLTASQRAIVAAQLVNSCVGGDRHSVKLPNEVTQEDVATLSGVAKKMVTDAAKVLKAKRPDLADKVLKGELAVNKAAKEVREEERQAQGKPKKKTPVKLPKTVIEYITAHDGPTALSAYSLLEEHLLDALQDVNDQSSFTHADEYARETIEKLEKQLSEMQPPKAEEAAA
jgi:hypothetical protein